MHIYRLNRLVTAVIMVVAAVIGALATAAPATGAAAHGSAVVTGPADGADPAALELAAQQHVTLAQAETRLSWQQAVPSLNAALSSRLPAAAFGGIWIAPNDGDRVKVGVVGSDPRVQATVLRAVRAAGLSTAADVVPVRYSARQIVRADAWLGAQLIRLPGARRGSVRLDVSYRMDLNRVQLGVAGRDLTPAERALIARAKARYDGLVQVVAQPGGSAMGTSLDCDHSPQFDYCHPPLRAGIEIFRLNSRGQPAHGQCTGGFIARSRTDGKLYQFTAGHCAAEDGAGTWGTYFPYPHPTVHAIGTVHHYVFGPRGDEAILNISNPAGWKLPQGWVYVMAGPNTTRNEEYPISSAQYSTQGARVCETGAASGTICGTVLALGVSFCEGTVLHCTWVDNLGKASFCGNKGDSGAPVFASHQAFGLVVAGSLDCFNSHVSYYQGIIGAANAMNVNLVFAH